MGYIWLIAIIIGIIFGFNAGAGFIGTIIVIASVALAIDAAYHTIVELIRGDFGKSFSWLLKAALWMGICYIIFS